MSGFVRCTSGNAGTAWTCVLPAGHDHGHIYTRWSEIAAMAEAEIQRVRELHGRHDPNCPYGEDCAGAGLCLACREEYPCATIRALEGDSDE